MSLVDLALLPSVLHQVLELDPLGYRYRFTVYPFEDHVAWAHYLGIGPHRVWWLSDLTADTDTAATRGATASVDAGSYARPDPR